MDIDGIIDTIIGFFGRYIIPNAGKLLVFAAIAIAVLLILRLILPALWENFLLFIIKRTDEHNNRKE